jgi:hypothetical protein
MKTLDSRAWRRAWRLLPTVSIHILLNFFGYIVLGGIGCLNVEKITLGSEFRLSYRLFMNNQTIIPLLCSSFKHLQPQLKNDPYIIQGLQQEKGGTVTCCQKSPSMSQYFKECVFFPWSYLDHRILHVHTISGFFQLFSPICTQNLAKSS